MSVNVTLAALQGGTGIALPEQGVTLFCVNVVEAHTGKALNGFCPFPGHCALPKKDNKKKEIVKDNIYLIMSEKLNCNLRSKPKTINYIYFNRKIN